MGLISALQNAVSGLNVSQAQIDIVSRNVANSGTVGYTRRVLNTQETSATGITAGAVRTGEVDRVLDELLQRQLRSETSGGAYSDVRANYLTRIDSLFGQPGSTIGINKVLSDFSTSIQQLATNPASPTTRLDTLSNAQNLAASINRLSTNVQTLRGEIESRLADDAQRANGLLDGIENTTRRLNEIFDSGTRQGLLDERDRYIDELSNYFDIRTFDNGTGNFNIYTTGGAPLFIEGRKLRLQFDERFSVSAGAVFNASSALSGVGHLTIKDPVGGAIELTNNGSIRSGSFAALFNLRDQVLTDTQNQLDEFAASLASSLGDVTVSSTAATVGAQQGFDLDINNLLSGNIISLDYTIQPAGTRQRVSFVAVNNPAALPLAAGATPNPNDIEVGIDFSGGIPAAITQIATALGAPFTVNDLGGGVVQILDDGAGNTRDINTLSARRTVTSLTNDGVALPFFVDSANGSTVYSGSLDGAPQKRGFAGSITLNPLILADPSRLIVYQTGAVTTGTGDPARPSFLRDQLQSAQTDFTPSVSLTGSTAIYRGTSSQFLDRVIATQTQAASNARSLSDGQKVVLDSLKSRVADVSGVKTDKELGDLIEIQNVYSANARLVSAVRDLFDILLRI